MFGLAEFAEKAKGEAALDTLEAREAARVVYTVLSFPLPTPLRFSRTRYSTFNVVKKYPKRIVTVKGPSRNVLQEVKQTGTDVLNNSGLHRIGTNMKRVNMTPYRVGSKVVSTRGGHGTTNTD